MRTTAIVITMLLCGCAGQGARGSDGGAGGSGGSGGSGGARDAGASDLGGSGDLATAKCATTTATKWVWKAVALPMQQGDYAFDLTGSGRALNQYTIINYASKQQQIDMEEQATSDVTSGREIMLLEVAKGTDCATVTLANGVATSAPDYSGKGTFTVDGSSAAARFDGAVAADGTFGSLPLPSLAKTPVQLVMPFTLPLVDGVTLPPVRVDVFGLHLAYSMVNGTLVGQLNGAIKWSDFKTVIVPGMTRDLQALVRPPLTVHAMNALAVFDNGGAPETSICPNTCTNPDNSCAAANDGKIDPCEVTSNSIVRSALAADVQMFDANGNYAPNPKPAAANKDAYSIGIQFTAVPATF